MNGFHRFFKRGDSSRIELVDAEKHRLELAVRLRGLTQNLGNGETPVLRSAEVLLEGLEHPPLASDAEFRGWLRSIGGPYEELADALRKAGASVPSLRPANRARLLFHVLSGLGVLALLELVLDRASMIWLPAGGFVWVWGSEFMRRKRPTFNERTMASLRRVAHPYERYRVHSGTWYVTALFGLGLLGSVPLAAVGVAVLAFADPAAGIVGRSFGRTELLNGRTLEGSLAFFFVAVLVTGGILGCLHGQSLGVLLPVALVTGVASALAELVSGQCLDDNFLVPLAAAGAAGFTSVLLHHPMP